MRTPYDPYSQDRGDMITVLEMEGATNKSTLGCRECMKILDRQDGLEAITQAAVDFLLGKANLHEERHPEHVLTITVYKRPEKNVAE